jgi:hypothetical protein
MSIKNNRITDIYLRNDYELYLDNNLGISYRYFLESNKIELFSKFRGDRCRTFYKKINSNLILVKNRDRFGDASYYKMELK